MTESEWNQVTAESPCPVCRKTKWCSVSTDGEVVVCRGEVDTPQDTGWNLQKAKTDVEGAPYRTWQRMGDSENTEYAIPAALAEMLENVYNTFIANLRLPRKPWQQLQRRGLSRKEVRYRQYGYADLTCIKRAANAVLDAGLEQYLPKVPGFCQHKHEKWSFAAPAGIVIPVRNLAGQTIAVKVRANSPQGDNNYVYASSRKHGGPRRFVVVGECPQRCVFFTQEWEKFDDC